VGGFHRGRIRDRIIVNRSQFDEKLLSTIRSDPKKFDSAQNVAMVHSADPKALQQILSDVENTRNALGATACWRSSLPFCMTISSSQVRCHLSTSSTKPV
jgi:hypothetical protein